MPKAILIERQPVLGYRLDSRRVFWFFLLNILNFGIFSFEVEMLLKLFTADKYVLIILSQSSHTRHGLELKIILDKF